MPNSVKNPLYCAFSPTKLGLAVALLPIVWWGMTAGPAGAENEPVGFAQAAEEGLITHFAPAANGQQHMLVVVDPQARTFAVYRINPTTGENEFRSERNMTWDLQMMEFNSGSPKPKEIREALNQR